MKQKEKTMNDLKRRYELVKKVQEHNKKLQLYEEELTKRMAQIKNACIAKFNQIKQLRVKSELIKAERVTSKTNCNIKQNLKFVSSGQNEHSNPYINQLKISQWSGQDSSSRCNRSQRNNLTNERTMSRGNLYENPIYNSRQQSHQMLAFRPQMRTKFSSNNYRLDTMALSQKRLASSYQCDEYATPMKRANLQNSNTTGSPNSMLSFKLCTSRDLNLNDYGDAENKSGITKISNFSSNSHLESKNVDPRFGKFRDGYLNIF